MGNIMSSYNCIICAEEFGCEELHGIASKISESKFKICQACIDRSDPTEDYKQVRNIVASYNVKSYFNQASEILKSRKS